MNLLFSLRDSMTAESHIILWHLKSELQTSILDEQVFPSVNEIVWC